MIPFLICLLIPFSLFSDTEVAEASLPLAPLLPVEEEFPLQLSAENRYLFIDGPEALEKSKEQIYQALQARSFPWISLTIILGLSGIGWFLYLMRDRLPKRALPIERPLSTKEKLENALISLERHPYQKDQRGAYYLFLTSIIHEVIEAKTGWNIRTLTTDQIEKKLGESSIFSGGKIEQILSLLNLMDKIKFSGQIPSDEERKIIIQHIQNFAHFNRPLA